MSNILNLLSEECFGEKMDTLNKLLAAIASNTGGLAIKSFADLQNLTRLGLASKVVSVGDQISCEKATSITAAVSGTGITAATVDFEKFRKATKTTAGAYAFTYDAAWKLDGKAADLAVYGITVTGTPANGDVVTVTEQTETLVWDVIGIDHDTPTNKNYKHSITLQLHGCYVKAQFDAKEALYYAENELAAGTYNFTIDTRPGYTGDNGKSFQFTLTNPVPAGGQIFLETVYDKSFVGKSIKTYANGNSADALETATVTEGSDGTALGVADGSINNVNSIQRIMCASSNWRCSAIRQLINSSAAAESVWVPQSHFDRPPRWNGAFGGFLKGIDDDFNAVVGKVDKVTTLNTVTDGGGSETNAERFFLLSRSEIYANSDTSISEGAAYSYYSDGSTLNNANSGNDTNRIKYFANEPVYWWLRTAYPLTSYNVRYASPTGSVGFGTADGAFGIAPACCIV